MIKMIITDAVVSKGYDGAPAIRFYDIEGGGQIVNFRIGKRVYDSKADDKHRWLNFTVKVFGDDCERIKRMKLKEGSYINIIARYDEDVWPDKETGEEKKAPVLILEEVEYSGGSGQKSDKNSPGSASQGESMPEPAGAPQEPQSADPPASSMPENFTGYESFGAEPNPFFGGFAT